MHRLARLLAILGLLSVWLPSTGPARAAALATVVGDGDADQCTYTDFTTALAGGGLITFNCGPNPHIIVLEAVGGVVPPAGTVTIDGGDLITFSGANVANRRLFNVGAGTSITFTHLTLANTGYTAGPGGGLHNAGRVLLDHVTMRANNVFNSYAGGAVMNDGLGLVVRASLFQSNTSAGGGAIYNAVGRHATIENSQFISNTVFGIYGGAISNLGTLTITTSSFTHNLTSLVGFCPVEFNEVCGGGALMNYPGATARVSQSQFADNLVTYHGGAILNKGTLYLNTSTLFANQAYHDGGGLATYAGTSFVDGATIRSNIANQGGGIDLRAGTMFISNSTLDQNSALYGAGLQSQISTATVSQTTISRNSGYASAGIFNYGAALTLTQVTVSDNLATGNSAEGSGGIGTSGTVRMTHVTISGNRSNLSGAGLYNASGSLFLTDVLFANNLLNTGVSQNCTGVAPLLANTSFNLTTDGTCLANGNGNRVNVPALLAPLADNGGPTLTRLPAPGSEPVDHGTCVGLAFDQRGLPRQVNGVCDIGAVERQAVDFGWYLFLPAALR